jgi:PKD repeat protein
VTFSGFRSTKVQRNGQRTANKRGKRTSEESEQARKADKRGKRTSEESEQARKANSKKRSTYNIQHTIRTKDQGISNKDQEILNDLDVWMAGQPIGFGWCYLYVLIHLEMKKLLLLLGFIGLFNLGQAQVQFVLQGQVTDIVSGQGIPNHPVTVFSDSTQNPMFFFYTTVSTNLQGFYTVNVPLPSIGNNILYVMTPDCNGMMQIATVTTINTPVVVNFQICSSGGMNCQAMFVATMSSSAPGMVQFTNLSTPVNPATGTLTCLWTFGDGTTSTALNPTHYYVSPGGYPVCLTITTGSPSQPLCTSTYCDSVIVTPGNPCSVSFGYQTSGLTANFTATTPAVQPFSFSWDFGDGTTGTGATPVHTYPSTGNYVVVLTMSGPNGCIALAMDSITIGAATIQQIYGTVLGNSGTIGQGPFQVVLMGFNPGTGGLVYDSTLTSAGGQYSFSNVPSGIYILRAEPLPGSAGYMNYFPTYYVNAPHWGTASTISLGQAQNPYNIQLIPVPGPGIGPASAGGTVYNSGTKGEPEADVEVLLKDIQGNILDLRYSNVSGQFDFSGIPYGTYQVYAEVPGLPTIPATVTLGPANPLVNNISITIMSTGVVTRIPELMAEDSKLLIYPNPAREVFSVETGISGSGIEDLMIFDLSGRMVEAVSHTRRADGAMVEVKADQLESGAYMLRIRLDNGRVLQGKVIITD